MDATEDNLQDGPHFLGRRLFWNFGHPQLRVVAGFCLFELAFYFAYRYGMAFSQACASPFWFPATVLLCALLLNPTKRWWLFIFAPLPIRLFVAVPPGVPLWFLLATFTIDSTSALLAAIALPRFVRNAHRLETIKDFALYCLVAVLLVPLLSAFVGAAARFALGYAYWSTWEQWFLGNALTHLVVTPLILYSSSISRHFRVPSLKHSIEGALLAVGLLLTGYIAIDTGSVRPGIAETRFYAPVPFLFWAAIRFGMLGASSGIALMAFLAVQAALEGRGLFAGQSAVDSALALQHFLLLRAAPLYLVAILVEQRKADERVLRESEERFRHMADSAPSMVWLTDPEKRCFFVNRGWLEFTGRTLDQEVGRGWADSVHPDDRQHCLEICYSNFEAKRPFEVEYRLRRHDGEYRWILDRGVPRYDSDGGFLGYIGSCLDITDRKHSDAELQKQRIQLAHVSRVSTLGQFASALAHELNQPLGAILRNAEAAELILHQNQPDYDELRAIVSDIRRDDQRAGAVIDRMKSLLKRRNLDVELLSLKQLFQQVIVLLRPEMLARRVTLQVDLPPHLPPVRGDGVHLQQVFLNLLLNGADAMTDLPVERRRLVVLARSTDTETIEVVISDNGHGIPADRLPLIFEPFFTTKSHGTGIGLAVSKTIVESHGGRIWAENNPHGGATFRFTLNVAEDVRSDVSPVPSIISYAENSVN
jgi:PAS domain S-box-containing protein